MLANRSDARDRAEAQFDKTQKPKDVGEKALSEYEKAGRVVREKLPAWDHFGSPRRRPTCGPEVTRNPSLQKQRPQFKSVDQ